MTNWRIRGLKCGLPMTPNGLSDPEFTSIYTREAQIVQNIAFINLFGEKDVLLTTLSPGASVDYIRLRRRPTVSDTTAYINADPTP